MNLCLRSTRHILSALLAFFMLIATSSVAHAQTGSLSGTVTQAGAATPLSGITVQVYNSSGAFQTSTATIGDGTFTVSSLTAGTYFALTQVNTSQNYLNRLYDNLACLLSCTVTSGTPIVVPAGGTRTGVNFALPVGGSVTGTVTDALTTLGIGSVIVQVFNSAGVVVRSATTAAGTGVFTAIQLPTGSYFARTSAPTTYVNELWDNLLCAPSCTVTTGTPIVVTAGLPTGGVNFALSPPGSITGTVTDASTAALLNGVGVQAFAGAGSPVAPGTFVQSATTNASGVYTLQNLGPANYYVRTFTSFSQNYIDELYNDLPCVPTCTTTTGTPVAVTNGGTASNINFPLSPGGSITGTVTDANTAAGLAVTVQVFNATGTFVKSVTATAGTGAYTVIGLPTGTYYARTTVSGLQNYADELYNEITCVLCAVTNGTPLTVTAGAVRSGVNFTLTPGGSITGAVTDAVSTLGISAINVNIYTSSGALYKTVPSAAGTGTFTAIGLASGTYYARTAVSTTQNYVDKLWNNISCFNLTCTPATGTPIVVTAGAVQGGINFPLTPGSTITGTVTDAGTTAGLLGVQVSIFLSSGGTAIRNPLASASGAYSVIGLPAGTYFARTFVSSSQNYIDEAYNDIPCAPCTVTSTTPIVVAASTVKSGVNFALAAGGSISGTVSDAVSTAAIGSVAVNIYNTLGTTVRGVFTDATGAYAALGLPAGTYFARTVVNSNTQNYFDELYDNIACNPVCNPLTGTAIVVTAGAAHTGVNFTLSPSGSISGIVTDGATGLANVTVQVFNSTGTLAKSIVTAANGTYAAVGLSTGTYFARTLVNSSQNFVDELYDNLVCSGTCTVTGGTPISVTSGTATAGINFALAAGGGISGAVSDAGTAAAIGAATVSIFNSSGVLVKTAITSNGTGAFTVLGLPAGTYYARTTVPANLNYFDELYNNLPCTAASCTVTSGTAIVVAGTATTGGVNFTLSPAGSITGFVTDASTTGGLGSVTVSVYDSLGVLLRSTTSAFGNGAYAIVGLPAGTYFARTGVQTTQNYLDEAYDNIPCNPSCTTTITSTTPIVVTNGAATSGINFALSPAGSISGFVTDSGTGAGLSGVSVSVLNSSTGAVVKSINTSNLTGDFTVVGLPAGTYNVRTTVPLTLNYIDEIYDNVPCAPLCNGAATPVLVTAGAVHSGINLALAAGGSITGLVSDNVTTAGLPGVTVQVFTTTGAFVKSVTSDGLGNFTVPGLASGNYVARTFVPPALGNYINELFNDIPCLQICSVLNGTPIAVTVGTTQGGVNFALSAGGSISGTVTDGVTTLGLNAPLVVVHSLTGTPVKTVVADSTGHYTASGIPAGTYAVRTAVLSTQQYINELYDNISCPSCSTVTGASINVDAATPVTVTGGATHGGVDFALAAGGSFSGTVTDAGTAVGLAGVSVNVFTSTGLVLKTTTTNNVGFFTANGLPTGSYFARTTVPANLNYVDELYDNLPCVPCVPTTGTPIAVTVGSTLTGVNFALAPGGSIQGGVEIDDTSTNVSGMPVLIYNSVGLIVRNVTTDQFGFFGVTGLPAGTYFARTNPSAASPYVPQLWEGEFWDTFQLVGNVAVTGGTPILVTPGTTQFIGFSVTTGGSLSGHVTDGGAPVANAAVAVYSTAGKVVKFGALTNSAGDYTVAGLPAGSYYVSIANGPTTTTTYLDRLYDNHPCLGCVLISNSTIPFVTLPCVGPCAPTVTTGNPVTVTFGGNHTGVNFALSSGAGSISGIVQDAATGIGLPTAAVTIYNAAGTPVSTVTTAGGNAIQRPGEYIVRGLPPGTYYARTVVNDSGQFYVDEAYGDVVCVPCNVTASTAIVVTANTLTPNIDFGLGAGGSITGIVTEAGSGTPLFLAGAQLYTSGGNLVKTSSTGVTGNFIFGGLPAGSYYVRTLPLPGTNHYVHEAFDNIPCNACPPGTGTPIAVAAGAAHSGIDFSLTRTVGPPALTSVVPNTAQQGQTLNVTFTGQNTDFVQGVTVLPVPGTDVTVNSTTVTDSTHVTMNLTISPTSGTGTFDVFIITGQEFAIIANGFTITPPIPVISQVAPNTGQQGQTLPAVAVTGSFTHFVNGVTSASFGAGITVNSTTVTDATHATVNLTVTAGAALGARTVTLTTGGESAALSNGFTVTVGTPVLTLTAPNSGAQGQANLNVVITGAFTHFVNGVTTAGFGAGITVNSTTVQSATQATANVTIALGAALGTRTVTVTTGGEVVSLVSGFTVTASAPTLTGVLPSAGRRGGAATLLVTLTAQATHFVPGTSVANFGAGVTVNSTTVQSATQAVVSLTIPAGAALGARTVIVTTGAEVVALPVAFVVTPFSVTRGDFDGDSRSDVAVFRPSTGAWYVRGVSTTLWGGGADLPVVGDYDGDGKADVAIFRPSTGVWFILLSGSATGSVTLWGGVGDIPAPGDYDGDGRTDVAVFRPSTGVWYVLYSGTGVGSVTTWGGGADIPAARDYDGDGKTDIAVFRPSTSTWYILQSSTAVGSVATWGGVGDTPVSADYDGDGKADVAVFRPSTGVWYILRSSTATGSVTTWGGGGDVPVSGDFDGDGKTDIVVFRPSSGNWFIINSSTGGGAVVTWGGGGDIPD